MFSCFCGRTDKESASKTKKLKFRSAKTVSLHYLSEGSPDSSFNNERRPQNLTMANLAPLQVRLGAYVGQNSLLGPVPPEILTLILEDMYLPTFCRFLLATYPMLRHHGLVEPLTRHELARMLSRREPPTLPVPYEIFWFIFDHIDNFRDKAQYVIAHYTTLLAIQRVPGITRSTFLMLLASLKLDSANAAAIAPT
ncbi:hypothetical protein EJ05DRAFT_503157 [Pseudovirgaria hyperparasitica]|uniref:F-box domain-containing protein n=1 Tax=Pseudovirgaria hyperparasitica TaxID=470096 RepID=A0A6A6W3T0_9PEZI|nr:uncharacterized protein EJ05DRAFT_503157 [Pseudovirgaria hyperparasitica]KAF2755701.1 hypothetical protein EJ05DRAFT_503157 [Pseudovirgaria hyperparasitica]